uniref:Ribonuclease H1 n=1 Tax=Neogobius melanostomus TaxID=47308 RepID=A0A8C6S7U8_9GOBI
MAKGKFYYAVRKGLKPGVYKTWDECKAQVDKFPTAVYKKFGAEKDAWAFFRGENPCAAPPKVKISELAQSSEPSPTLLPKRGPEPLEYIPLGPKRRRVKEEEPEQTPSKRLKQEAQSSDAFTYMGDSVVVYTDGCCSGNGKSSARAGIGVYWGPRHPLNVADRLDGRQTNQRAEIQAACRALELAKQNNIHKLVLYTDSKFTINGVTSWVKSWKLNGWRLKSGGNIINKDDFIKLDALNSELHVTWIHIPGHAGYHGNEEADRLSREGAAKPAPSED